MKYWNFFTTTKLYSGSSYPESCSPGLSTPGWTFPPGDVILEHGQSLEIFCILDLNLSKGHNATHLVFYRNNEPISSKHISVLNETTAVLHVDSPPPSKSMYYCKLKIGNEHNFNNTYSLSSLESSSSSQIYEPEELIVCLNNVAIGTKPTEAENLTCISHNWEKLTCNWTSSFNYIKTTYEIYYYPPGRSGRRSLYNCPTDDDKLYNNCTWSIDSNPSYRQTFEYLYILVNGSNVLGNSTVSMKFHNYAHMIPSPPSNLQILDKTISSVLLQWSIGMLIVFEKGLIYKVEYTWNSTNPWNVVTYNQNEVNKTEDKICINATGLPYPNLAYDFRIYMRSSIAKGNVIWSQPASIIVKTKSCAPYSPPKTNIGSFEISHLYPKQRDIYVYWQSLSRYEQNGEDFRYNIMTLEDNKLIHIKPSSITNAYAKFTNLGLNSYHFLITSVNKEGSSAPSEIFVPNSKNIIDEPSIFTKIDFGNGVYELSWKHSHIWKNITNFTIFWCDSDRDRPYHCDGRLNWTYLPVNSSIYNITVELKKTYQFAISANSLYSSSGMVWASCTVLHDKVGKMKNVWINKIGSDFIEVGWKLECSDRVEGIEGYYLFYCPVILPTDTHCTGSEQNITIVGDSSTVRGNITNLKPYMHYKIATAVFTKDGRPGPRSDELYNHTLESAPDTTGTNVTILEITNTTATLSWNAPKVMNGIFQHYEVRYNDTLVKTNETIVTLSSLKCYSNYAISISACTKLCSVMDRKELQTSIGIPGTVQDLTVEKINSSFVLVMWKPPDAKAGPFIMYDVKVLHDEGGKKNGVYEWRTNGTEIKVPIPNCKDENYNSSYTFYVRAETRDDSTGYEFIYSGDWSRAYTFGCFHLDQVSLAYKLSLYFLLFVCVIVSVFVGRSSMYKCRKMKEVQVILPPNFTVPPLFDSMKDNEYHISSNAWKDKNELDRLNTKLSETDYEDDIDNTTLDMIDRDENFDTDPYSSGCCTGRSSTTSSITGGGTQTSDSGTEMESKIDPSSLLCDVSDNVQQQNEEHLPSEGIKWDTKSMYSSSLEGNDVPWMKCYTPVLNRKGINDKPNPGYVTLQHFFSTLPNNDNVSQMPSNGYVSVVKPFSTSIEKLSPTAQNDFPPGYCRVALSENNSNADDQGKALLLFPGYLSINPDVTLCDNKGSTNEANDHQLR